MDSRTKLSLCSALLLVTTVLHGCAGAASRGKRADDVNPLEATVAQQGALLQSLQAKLTALEAETTALKSRQQTLSTKVAFSARFSSDNIPLSTHTTLKFDNVITNVGSAYDSVTGIFTAPVSGVYLFFLTAMAVNGHTEGLYLSVNKHGTILDEVFAYGATDYDQGSCHVSTHLSGGEQVWVRQEGGNIVRGATWTVFTGYLLLVD